MKYIVQPKPIMWKDYKNHSIGMGTDPEIMDSLSYCDIHWIHQTSELWNCSCDKKMYETIDERKLACEEVHQKLFEEFICKYFVVEKCEKS